MSLAPISQVLVIDDDANLRTFVVRGLQSRFRMFSAASVAEAEPILAAEEIKVIICDDQMPEETGLMFLARIRDQLPWTRRILLTGNGEQAALVFAINQVHVFRYLIKPVGIEELRRLVQEGVEWYEQARGSDEAAQEGVRLRTTVARHLQSKALPEAEGSHESRVWLRLIGWGSTAAAVLFGLGLCLLLALYFVKTWLGIDLFADRHLSDFW